jgi:uncharacterized ferredoxin-like protein
VTSRTGLAIAFVLALLPEPAHANERLSRLLDAAAIATAYAGTPDIVTAYVTGMARFRLTSARDGTAMTLEPPQLRAEFRARSWRAADGSLLQGFAGKGGFRLTLGNCLSQMCSCSDGRRRKMAVADFTTATFDGVTYRRLSAPPKAQGD